VTWGLGEKGTWRKGDLEKRGLGEKEIILFLAKIECLNYVINSLINKYKILIR
jgi:hypothetical protein